MLNRKSIQILAHRGFWKEKPEQNTEGAFRKALELCCGIETDFRDLDGELVISHDMALGGALPARRLFEICKEYEGDFSLAINIKAEGLLAPLKALLTEFNIRDYFCFDLSVPEAFKFTKQKLRIYTRVSEIEPVPFLFPEAEGLWLDQFFGDWLTPEVLAYYAGKGKALAIVSPELHGRSYQSAWELYRNFSKKHPDARLLLCTDLVNEALEFFA